jgi:hypothetical protein
MALASLCLMEVFVKTMVHSRYDKTALGSIDPSMRELTKERPFTLPETLSPPIPSSNAHSSAGLDRPHPESLGGGTELNGIPLT